MEKQESLEFDFLVDFVKFLENKEFYGYHQKLEDRILNPS